MEKKEYRDKKEYKKQYGFLGIGQFGGNITRKFEEAGYPCIAANSSQEDLDTLYRRCS
ncbi:MAG: hypothetical protein K2N61_11830 [Lachnospiraceae bacterium]|nr:hypothetical protein [Lachnospiraceae bacterium]